MSLFKSFTNSPFGFLKFVLEKIMSPFVNSLPSCPLLKFIHSFSNLTGQAFDPLTLGMYYDFPSPNESFFEYGTCHHTPSATNSNSSKAAALTSHCLLTATNPKNYIVNVLT